MVPSKIIGFKARKRKGFKALLLCRPFVKGNLAFLVALCPKDFDVWVDGLGSFDDIRLVLLKEAP